MVGLQGNPCAHADCPRPAVRRCYFCPNVVCAEHAVINDSGAICFACSQREDERQEERTRRAEATQASVKASGCLIALLVVPVLITHTRALVGFSQMK